MTKENEEKRRKPDPDSNELRPGEWPELTAVQRRRLVAIARRKLFGYDHLAEDAVSRAVERWQRLAPSLGTRARIEQVVKSEALSILRSTRRSEVRDTTWSTDRSRRPTDRPSDWDGETVELWEAMVAEATRQGTEITDVEREVFVLLLAGHSASSIARDTTLSRYQIRAAQARWRGLALQVFESAEAS